MGSRVRIRNSLRPAVLLALAALVTPTAPLAAADGDPLAVHFAAFDFGGSNLDSGEAVVVQPDGKVVVAGTVATGAGTYALALARFLPGGGLDNSFGFSGGVLDPFGFSLNHNGVALRRLADGRFLVAGALEQSAGDQDFFVGRLLDSGAPDGSFGSTFTGVTVVSFDQGGDWTDALSAMTVDRSGRILLVGSVDVSPTDIDFGVARLTADGLLDTMFSGDGKATVDFPGSQIDFGLAVDVDSDGRVVLAGATWATDAGGHFNVALARLLSNGTLDSGFGSGGTLVGGMAEGGTNNEFAWAVAVWPDGEIVVGGDIATGVDEWEFLLVSYSPTGAFVNLTLGPYCSFGSPTCPAPQDSIRALRLQSDGKIVFGGLGRGLAGNSDFGVGRFHRNLAVDFSFGDSGRAILDLGYGIGGGNDAGTALTFDHDGRIVVAGWAEWNGLDTDFAWARFDSSYIFADGFEWPGGTSRWSSTVP